MDGEAKSEEKKTGEDVVEIPVGKYLDKIRNNPWKVSTVVLAIFLVAVLVFYPGSGGGDVVSREIASQNLIDFINVQSPSVSAEIVSVEQEGSLYKAMVNVNGNEVPIYLTLDGEFAITSPIPLSATAAAPTQQPPQQQAANVPKSDKPQVELFIWSYCPYGVTAQGPLAEVASLLGNDADFEAVLYHDGHGAYETQQNKIQACIQEIAEDKYWNYAAGFVENIYPKCGSSKDIECDKTESVKLMKSSGINDAKVMSCVEDRGADLIAEHSNRAREYGVTGSPTLVVNGVKANVARTSEAFKTVVCDAFNDAPEECGTALSSAAAQTSGSC